MNERTVCVHAWRRFTHTDGTLVIEYCDPADGPHGWTVYTREEQPDPREPFDILEEYDFTTEEEALTKAENLATRYQCEIDLY